MALSEIYLSCFNLFLQFLYYRRINNRLKTVVSMLTLVLLREVTIHIQNRLQNPVFLRIRKRSSLCEFDWEENPEKWLKQSKIVSISLKWNLCICVWEKRNNRFEITVIILRYIRNLNLFKKDFKLQNFLLKHTFFFNLKTVLKMAKKTNKRDVESICTKVTRHIKNVAKAQLDLN